MSNFIWGPREDRTGFTSVLRSKRIDEKCMLCVLYGMEKCELNDFWFYEAAAKKSMCDDYEWSQHNTQIARPAKKTWREFEKL